MVCEAWNRGVSCDVTSEDVTLCELALEVTQCLPSYKDIYQKHMRPIIEQYKVKRNVGGS